MLKFLKTLIPLKPLLNNKYYNKMTAFYISCYTHFHHYKKIFDFLPKESFVLLIFRNKKYKDFSKNIKEEILKQGINALYFDDKEVIYYRFKYLIQMGENYNHLNKISDYYIRYMVNGNEFTLGKINDISNIFFCQGKRNIQILKKFFHKKGNIYVEGGYARLQNLKIDKVYKIKKNPKIFYIPTHGNSSIKYYYREIINLSNYFDVFAKFHPDTYTDCEEKDILNKFRNSNIKIIEENLDPESWLTSSDIFISDFGGSTLLGLYLNKPTILLDPPEETNHYDFLRQNQNDIEPSEILLRNFLTTLKYKDKHYLDYKFIKKEIKSFSIKKQKKLRDLFFFNKTELPGKIFAKFLLKKDINNFKN